VRYKSFHFANFKGIRDLDLDLTGDVTTLIGLNESGKTTILEAIFCFSYGAENLDAINPGMASLRDPEQWIPISKRANFNDTISICATVVLDPEDKAELSRFLAKEHSVRVVDLPDEIKICERYSFENSRYVKAKTRRTWALTLMAMAGQQRKAREYESETEEWQAAINFLKDRLPRIWYFPNFLFELPEKFVLESGGTVAVAAEEQAKSQFYRATFEQVLGQLSIDANLDEHVVQRLRSDDKADQRNLRSVLLDMGRVISGTILEGWSRIFGSAPAGQEVELIADTTASGDAFLEMKIKGADGYYDLSERSLGFRWFFMFLLMTPYRGIGTGDGPRALFLLDEPASNLHSTAQAELLKSFETLSQSCHLVYTTHSHHLINLRWLDAAYVVKNEALQSFSLEDYLSTRMGAQTSVSAAPYRRFVAENPAETSYIQPVLDLLEYRPSELEPVPDVVLVEGKTDFYLLRYMTEILGIESDLRFVPGTGAGSLDALIKLHIGWGKTFLVLLDGDAEGIKQRERYLERYGPVIQGRCVLLPELAGSGIKEAEDLLSEVDKAAMVWVCCRFS
jgi:energy-coupling factor transporter ATP-binding protein EcfA2